MSRKTDEKTAVIDEASVAPLKTALWIGALCTVAASAVGWVGAIFWVVSRGGVEHLVDYTREIFYFSAAGLWCAVIASLSAYTALRFRLDKAPPRQRARVSAVSAKPVVADVDAVLGRPRRHATN